MDFDLIIVGAGIVGVLSAYYALQRNPKLRTLIIDKDLAGNGATHYSIGLDYHFGHQQTKIDMARESVCCWQKLSLLLPKQQFKLPLYGVVSQSSFARIQAGMIDGPFENTGDVNLSSFQIQPILGDGQTCFKGGDCEYYDTRAVIMTLISLLKTQYGCSIWEGIKVNKVIPSDSSFYLILDDKIKINCKKLLLATGPWSVANNGMELFGQLALRTKKIVTLHVENKIENNEAVFFLFDEDAFLLPVFNSQRYIFSFTVLTWDVHLDKNSFTISPAEKEMGVSILKKYFPALGAHCHGGRTFCDAYSPDWTPCIQPSTLYPGAIIATGGSGSGFRLAPAMANRALDYLGV